MDIRKTYTSNELAYVKYLIAIRRAQDDPSFKNDEVDSEYVKCEELALKFFQEGHNDIDKSLIDCINDYMQDYLNNIQQEEALKNPKLRMFEVHCGIRFTKNLYVYTSPEEDNEEIKHHAEIALGQLDINELEFTDDDYEIITSFDLEECAELLDKDDKVVIDDFGTTIPLKQLLVLRKGAIK